MVTKKNKKLFLLFFSIFLLLTVLYFSLNKVGILEGLSNKILPLTDSSSDSDFCGSSDPYDSDGAQINTQTVYDSDTKIQDIEKGDPFTLSDSAGDEIEFSDIMSSSSDYNFGIVGKDESNSDLSISDMDFSSGTSTTNNDTGKEAREYTNIIKDSSDSERCEYKYYVENNQQ